MKNKTFTEDNEGNEGGGMLHLIMKTREILESPHVVSYIGNRKFLALFVIFVCFCLNCPAQSVVDFYLTQFTGNTNDTTINVQAANNPIIYNGQYFWWPQHGTNIATTNGFASLSLVPGKYTVSIASVSTAWTITVTNSATALNAAYLTTQITIYNGINSLSGAGVTTDGHGNYTVIGIGSATNFVSGQNTTWTNIGGNNQVNITGTLTNNTTGSAAMATFVTGVQSNQPPEVQAMKPTLWIDMSQVVATNNNQPLSSVPDFSGNGLTLFSGTVTPPLYLDGAHGIGGRPALYMEANWNPVTGASPTVSYALTNSLQFGNSNYSITIVYLDTLQLGGSGCSPELNGGISPYLFQDGLGGSATLALAYYSQYFENQNGCSYCQLASTAQVTALPLHFQPVVITFRLQNGYQDEFINGVQVALTNTASFSYGTSTGNLFVLGNFANGSGVITPNTGAFCGKMAEVLVTASNAPSTSAILAYHAELMKKYNFGGGPWINLVGDSITFGTLGTAPTNFYGLTKSAFPGAFVSDVGMPGEASTPIYTTAAQTPGVKPYGTTIVIEPCMFGVNDNLQGGTLTNWETNVINTAILKHAQGHLVDWCTLPSFNGESNVPTRASMNAFIYANSNLFDAIVDYASDKLMGTNGSCMVESNLYNEVYAPIGVHPLPAGYQELFTNWLFPVLQAQLSGGGASTPSYTGQFTGGGANLSLGFTTTNGVSISMIQSLPVGQTIRVICSTNVPGSTNGANTVVTNSCASFYLSGSPASPGIYEVRGQVGGQCTNSTDGFYISLGSYLGTDFGEGWYGYQPNQSYFSAGFNSTRLAFCDSFGVTNNIGIFDFRTTTVQTNQYNWQIYQVVNSPADMPLLNTNTFFTITRWQ